MKYLVYNNLYQSFYDGGIKPPEDDSRLAHVNRKDAREAETLREAINFRDNEAFRLRISINDFEIFIVII